MSGFPEKFEPLRQRLTDDSDGAPFLEWIDDLNQSNATLDRDLKRQRIDFSTIIEISNQINSKGLDTEKIESYTLTMMRGQFGVRHTWMMRRETFDAPDIVVTGPDKPDFRFDAEGPFAQRLAEISRPLTRDEYAADGEAFPEIAYFQEKNVQLLVPLVHSSSERDRSLKGLLLMGPKIGDRPFSEKDRELASVLANMVAISLHNAQLYHRSIVDGLTRVYSRGHFDVHLMQEISRARRFLQREQREDKSDPAGNRYVSLVMVDIDHFKGFNDKHGHQAGDRVLQAVAGAMHESVRSMDIVARYGGEEFALVFPETRKDDAGRIAERLRGAVEKLAVEVEDKDPLSVTISLGVATFPDDAADIRGLVAKADGALYEAKSAGRNRVILA